MKEDLFGEIIRKTLEELPPDLKGALGSVEIVVQEKPNQEQWRSSGSAPDEDLFGLFEGHSLKEMPLGTDRYFPDRISLFQGPLERHYPDRKVLAREIRKTLIHELGHYFGFDEEELRQRGWG